MSHFKTTLFVAVLSSALALPASAYEAGDWIIRVGAANVDPDVDSDAVPVGDVELPNGIDVDDDTQVGLNIVYMWRPTIGFELLAATPFEHDISLEDAPIEAGSTKHLPPTLTANWYPMGDSNSPWQPFIGVGINYTTFWDEEVDQELEAAIGEIIGATGPVPANMDIDDSWGIAGRAGLDYYFNDNWGISASVWYIQIEAETEILYSGSNTQFDADLDPWVYMIGATYKF